MGIQSQKACIVRYRYREFLIYTYDNVELKKNVIAHYKHTPYSEISFSLSLD